MMAEDWCDRMIAHFALQAVASAVGVEIVRVWLQHSAAKKDKARQQEIEQQQDLPSEEIVAQDEVGEVGSMDVAEGDDLESAEKAEGAPPSCPTLADAMDDYDGGESHGGSFASLTPSPVVSEIALTAGSSGTDDDGAGGDEGGGLSEVKQVCLQEGQVKRGMHLLSQLCLVDMRMLRCHLDIYSAHQLYLDTIHDHQQQQQKKLQKQQQVGEGAADQVEASASGAGTGTGTAAGTEDLKESASSAWTLKRALRADLANILPAVSQSHPSEDLFSVLAGGGDDRALPLLEHALYVMHPDHSVPPRPALVNAVGAFIRDRCIDDAAETAITANSSSSSSSSEGKSGFGDSAAVLSSDTKEGASDTSAGETEAAVAGGGAMEVDEAVVTTAATSSSNASISDSPSGGSASLCLQEIKEERYLRLALPLAGALSAADIESSLPYIIKMFYTPTPSPSLPTAASTTATSTSTSTAAATTITIGPHEDDQIHGADALRMLFSRVTKARPPPMAKSTLLVALHRIDLEKHQMPTKYVLDAIAICLANKSDFTGEVIKTALRVMLQDDVPPLALMRTAILSAQAFGDVKRYVLSDVIPQLVRKRVWTVAPKLWGRRCLRR